MSALTSTPAEARRRVRGEQRPSPDLTRCPACDSSNFTPWYPRQISWLRRCAGCGLGFVHPQPDDDELDAIYGPDYFTNFGWQADRQTLYRRIKQEWFASLLQTAEQYFSPGRLLDVGSALGDMLAVAECRGWEAAGVEYNAHAAAVADDVAGEKTWIGKIEDLPASHTGYDLVTCTEVLEHLRRPDVALQRMFDALNPGGGLVLTTIDTASAPRRMLGFRWYHFHRDHLWYFNKQNLTALAGRAGFRVISCSRAWKRFHLDYVLHILKSTPNSGFLRNGARFGLRSIPAWMQRRSFPFPEGLLLIARRA